jgi:hypothetical protein
MDIPAQQAIAAIEEHDPQPQGSRRGRQNCRLRRRASSPYECRPALARVAFERA